MWPFSWANKDEASSSTTPKSPPEPTVDLLDHAAVKRALDDALAEAILEAGAVEDLRLFNWKFGLGAAACLVALLAQFYPGKPPATAPLPAGCVAAYVALSAASAAFAQWVERDAFLVTRAQPSGPGAMRVSSTMPRFSPQYELVVEATDGSLLGGHGGGGSGAGASSARPRSAATAHAPARVTLALSATSFFRADGSLDKEAVGAAAARALAELDSRRKTS